MKVKKLLAIALSMLIFMEAECNNVMAEEIEVCEVKSSIQQEAVELLYVGYGTYYDFLGSTATLIQRSITGDAVEEVFMLEVDAVLRADKVSELDYFKGIMEYYEEATTSSAYFTEELESDAQLQDQATEYESFVSAVSNELSAEYDALDQYIGKEQILRFYVKAVYNENNVGDTSFLFENGSCYVPVEQMYPLTPEELHRNGYEYMQEFGIRTIAEISDRESGLQSTTSNFSVFNAVMYSETYTSNPSSCNVHGSTCDMKVDTTKYNPNYPYYVEKHNDCANFVSQILHAGGIPTDSEWAAGKVAWTSISCLEQYMSGKGYWNQVSYSLLAVGDVVNFGGHIVFVAANDGVSFRYSAHTNDRKDVVLSNSGNYKYYHVIY